jgi:hypothetical protein
MNEFLDDAAIGAAIDVDHKSFVMAINDLPRASNASVKGAIDNIFRVGMSDFKTISSGAVPVEWSFIATSLVFGAVPANQVSMQKGFVCVSLGRRHKQNLCTACWHPC